MAITDWPVDERPREKLLLRGPNALSDAELLAIFLRTGCSGLSAVDLARNLLADFGSLRALLEANQDSFCEAHGLGKAKFAQLQAVLEMSRRHLAEELSLSPQLNSSNLVKSFAKSQLRHKTTETFAIIHLNSQHRLIAYEELFEGTLDSAPVYPREVLKAALRHNSSAVVLSHNHPSGVAEPSHQDRLITSRLQEALNLVDIEVLDHVVVGAAEPVSFAERGWL